MSLLKKAFTGDVTACIFYLSNRSPDRWKRNGQVDVQISSAPAEKDWTLEEIMRTYSGAVQQTLEGGPGCTP